MSFHHELVLITGATSGVGEAVASLLAQKKIPLILTGRNKKSLETIISSLKEKTEVTPLVIDFTKENEFKQLIDLIHEKKPDLVINCAGYAFYGKVLEKPTQMELDVFHVNSSIPIKITVEAARALYAADKKGTILNVSSIASYFIFPYLASYAAAKLALTHFCRSFHEEMRPSGISILASCPGKIATNFIAKASNKKEVNKHSFSMTTKYAAKRILRQIKRKKPLIDRYNWSYKLYYHLYKILPNSFFLLFIKKEMKKLYDPQPYLKE